MQSISFAKIMRQKGIKPPPLCFVVKQNIGEVSCNDGGVRKIPAVGTTESGELICYAASRNYTPYLQ